MGTLWESAGVDLSELVDDLEQEGAALDEIVAGRIGHWDRQTEAEGWTVAHQIGHLAWTDKAASLAAADPAGFGALVERALQNPDGFVDAEAEAWAAPALAGTDGQIALLERWREGRAGLTTALSAVAPGSRLPWFGPPMSAASMATARLMETWAHGQDVADAFEVVRPATMRLRHVAHIAVRARGFAYSVNGEEPPDADIAVVLDAPDGSKWTWGELESRDRVEGPALDFCLLATRRRHRDDLALVVTGAQADHWMDIIQAFAGPPGPSRPPAGGVSA